MREKLIELLLEVDSVCGARDCEGCADDGICYVHRAADNLIANGVTVREKGEWDDSGRYQFTDGTKAIRCTECGCALTEIEYKKYFYNFCPVCGADMKGAEHETD